MQNLIFTVNDEPYCIWEVSFSERNKEFLDGIDTQYFDYILNLHLGSEDKKRASIGLRTALYHSLETLFSLLGAYIQAPLCPYAWLAKCSNKELRQLVANVGRRHNRLYNMLNIESVSWESVSKAVFQSYIPGTEKNVQTTKLFASLWHRLAQEFCDSNNIDEYNCIKHGFRVRSGGFALAVGLEHEYGVAPPENEMKIIGSSEHGSTFFKIETIGSAKKNRSIRSKRTSVNWKFEKIALLVQLVAMSITNVVSALKIANGAKAGTCNFLRPKEDSDFDRPWTYLPGVTSCNMDFAINESEIISTTKEELKKKIDERFRS